MTDEELLEFIKEKECFIIPKDSWVVNGIDVNKAIEDADKYKWHDLRKNPDDLPKLDTTVIIATSYGDSDIEYCHDFMIDKNGEKVWCLVSDYIIAWKYIQEFSEE